MKVDAQAGRAGYKTLPKKSKQRGKGYLWIVERRIDGKRKRRFFRNGEADERDAYIAAIDEQIDDLIHAHQGHSENMSDESRETYRQLARQRDDILNQMRTMEQTLFNE